LLIRDIERPSAPQQGLHMLPNFRIVIGAVMFAVLLFAITGAGVVMPDTYTRVGEVPEIGRPMMQRMVTDEPAQAQFLALTLMRRADELGRLQERIALEVEMEVETARTEADPDPGIAKQVAIEAPEADAAVPAVAAVPALQPSGAMGTVPAAAPASAADAAEAPPVAATATPNDVPETPAAKPEPEPVRTAALPLKAEDAKPPETEPVTHVRVPHLRRPTSKAGAAHRHTFHHPHRFARTQAGGLSQDPFGKPSFQMQ
jgi:hypothetical protein